MIAAFRIGSRRSICGADCSMRSLTGCAGGGTRVSRPSGRIERARRKKATSFGRRMPASEHLVHFGLSTSGGGRQPAAAVSLRFEIDTS